MRISSTPQPRRNTELITVHKVFKTLKIKLIVVDSMAFPGYAQRYNY
jgi:hypothetical protein